MSLSTFNSKISNFSLPLIGRACSTSVFPFPCYNQSFAIREFGSLMAHSVKQKTFCVTPLAAELLLCMLLLSKNIMISFVEKMLSI